MKPKGPDGLPEFTIFGQVFKVLDEQSLMEQTDGTGRHLIFCMRVADMDADHGTPAHRARRMIVKCHQCKERIWFDPQSSPYPPGAIRMCSVCILASSKDDLERLFDE